MFLFSVDGLLTFLAAFQSICIYCCFSLENKFLLLIVMVALWNRADRYIFALWFLSFFFFLSFFPRLILAVADWMSAILPHMVWP